ncbi:MAG: hypothetical protein IKH61_03815 [Bacteroidales bacterium]|nr:hypothetical protein [Bacteroidales bacterium]
MKTKVLFFASLMALSFCTSQVQAVNVTNQNTICISDVVLNDYKNNILDYWTNGGFTPVKPLDHILTGWYIQFVQLNNNAYTWNVTAYHAKPNCTDTPPIID